jgi:hypothetical protein
LFIILSPFHFSFSHSTNPSLPGIACSNSKCHLMTNLQSDTPPSLLLSAMARTLML